MAQGVGGLIEIPSIVFVDSFSVAPSFNNVFEFPSLPLPFRKRSDRNDDQFPKMDPVKAWHRLVAD